ncbi:outer membrane protein assembly factor BamD [Eleftheria terrae]|uniref:outer membrane protein assembly factor BamD n=1 Tax=Eleftheria terrae TaxID=1597781 RepID=UPI00263B8536|nr:outer membrane protein assembly factor BamD [Eleftheria terrae]WKB53690.1 outer membrane protein assembly factor BamD [Eleftheria terrae]
MRDVKPVSGTEPTSARRVSPSAALAASAVALALLAGCSSTPKDETAGMSTEKLYAEAKDEAAAGNYERAIKFYERLEGRAAGTVLAQQAQLELAYLYYRTNEKAQALATLDRFAKLHPSSPAMDYALYLRGVVNFNDNLGLFGKLSRQDLSERDQQASKDAFQAFKQLVEQFPTSNYAPDARLRMGYIVNALAAYEVHVARYYFRRGAYLAAANRAQQTVQDYQQSPALEEALYIMARSYDRLGLTQLRDDAERVLKTSFPDSPYLARGFDGNTKPWWQLW